MSVLFSWWLLLFIKIKYFSLHTLVFFSHEFQIAISALPLIFFLITLITVIMVYSFVFILFSHFVLVFFFLIINKIEHGFKKIRESLFLCIRISPIHIVMIICVLGFISVTSFCFLFTMLPYCFFFSPPSPDFASLNLFAHSDFSCLLVVTLKYKYLGNTLALYYSMTIQFNIYSFSPKNKASLQCTDLPHFPL